MNIKSIEFTGYRNLEDGEIKPGKEMNVICGRNAQGKTNLIESIWLFTGAKSFRGNKDNEILGFGKNFSRLKMIFESFGVEKEAEIVIENKRKAKLNGNNLSSASLLAGNFCAVIFSPDDLSLISDGPQKRRKFLDTAISQIYPKYIEILRAYTRAVAQRNYLLKKLKSGEKIKYSLDDFENEIVNYGIKALEYRKKYVSLLKPYLKEIYSGISSGKEEAEINYVSTFSAENFREELKASRKEDTVNGYTGIGIHRDDLEFEINGISARNFGSQGQKRSLALCLKLSEAKVLKLKTGEYPVALLDDVMSELDSERQKFILNHIKGWQVFITCCDTENIKFLDEGKIFKMESGVLTE